MDNMRSSLSVRKELIRLNQEIDKVKSWSGSYGPASIRPRIESYHLSYCDDFIFDVLLVEDRRYFKHRGVELLAIPRGLKRGFRYGRVGGVSTIEQQLVRTINNRKERKAYRKFREILIAFIINYHQPKWSILLAYLNTAYFGPRLYGAEIASTVIFGMPVSHLDSEKSAFLASLLAYPVPPKVARVLRDKKIEMQPSEIIEYAEMDSPWWAARVKSRMAYIRELRTKYSKDALLNLLG